MSFSMAQLVNSPTSGRLRRRLVSGRPILPLLLLVGCNRGPELAPVSGRITLDGQPLAVAQLIFQPDARNSASSYGLTDEGGHYELRYGRERLGALVGSHTVRIRAATELTGPKGGTILRPQILPPRYNSQSELHREVKSGVDNQFDFDLSSKAK